MATMLRKSSVSDAYTVAHELHEGEADHSLHNPDATMRQRKAGAGRLLTSTGAEAFGGGGLIMGVAGGDNDGGGGDDALWQKHERAVRGVDYLQVESAVPTMRVGGRALNPTEVAALERDKAAVRETIQRHASAGLRNLDKMNANLLRARASCAAKIGEDRQNLHVMRRAEADAKGHRAPLEARLARDRGERAAAASAALDAAAAMRELIAASKGAGRRIARRGQAQERAHNEAELEALRGYSTASSCRTPSPQRGAAGRGRGSPTSVRSISPFRPQATARNGGNGAGGGGRQSPVRMAGGATLLST